MGIPTRRADLCPRLRPVVLGRAACALGDLCGDDGHDPGAHGSGGDHFPRDPEAHPSPVLGTFPICGQLFAQPTQDQML